MSHPRIVLLLSLFICFSLNVAAQVETTPYKNWSNLKLNNDMNALFKPIATENGVEITFLVKTGSVYETDSLAGIAHVLQTVKAAKVSAYLEKNKDNAAFQNTRFTSHTSTEHAAYKFNTTAANAEACFLIMKDQVFLSGITEEELNAAKAVVMEEIKADANNPKVIFENKILKKVYRQDFKKLNTTGDSISLPNITPNIIREYAAKYYVVNNTIATVAGNFTIDALQMSFQNVFSPLIRGEFDPETITRMIHYRPMIYSSQLVMEDSVATPEFQICWQFQGVNVNERASYSAFLLATALNDPNNFIQAKARKMGCKKLLAQYDANNFTGVFRVIIQPDKSNLFATYSFVLSELLRLEETLANESMLNAGKIQFKNRYTVLQTTKYFPEEAARYMAFKDENYYQELADSIWTVTERDFKLFLDDYINNRPFVAALRISSSDRQNLNTDSVFAELDENVGSYVFRYRHNITDLEGLENTTMLNNLLQWLKNNEDVYVQINGFSDEGEYNRFKSDTLIQFIDSLPTFAKSKIDLVKKGYFRPDLMRALKVVKYLYENGIQPERLAGTGMKFSSRTDEEAAENMKCTITLNKIHQSQSLYEKYYGKKKE